jgi:hypothetical protein
LRKNLKGSDTIIEKDDEDDKSKNELFKKIDNSRTLDNNNHLQSNKLLKKRTKQLSKLVVSVLDKRIKFIIKIIDFVMIFLIFLNISLSLIENELTINYVSVNPSIASRLENLTVGQLISIDLNGSFTPFNQINQIIGIIKSNGGNQIKIVYSGLSLNQSANSSATGITIYPYIQITNIINIFTIPSLIRYTFNATDTNVDFTKITTNNTPIYAINNYVYFENGKDFEILLLNPE